MVIKKLFGEKVSRDWEGDLREVRLSVTARLFKYVQTNFNVLTNEIFVTSLCLATVVQGTLVNS